MLQLVDICHFRFPCDIFGSVVTVSGYKNVLVSSCRRGEAVGYRDLFSIQARGRVDLMRLTIVRGVAMSELKTDVIFRVKKAAEDLCLVRLTFAYHVYLLNYQQISPLCQHDGVPGIDVMQPKCRDDLTTKVLGDDLQYSRDAVHVSAKILDIPGLCFYCFVSGVAPSRIGEVSCVRICH